MPNAFPQTPKPVPNAIKRDRKTGRLPRQIESSHKTELVPYKRNARSHARTTNTLPCSHSALVRRHAASKCQWYSHSVMITPTVFLRLGPWRSQPLETPTGWSETACTNAPEWTGLDMLAVSHNGTADLADTASLGGRPLVNKFDHLSSDFVDDNLK